MIELFDIEKGKVTPTKHCYTIKTFKNIMDNYPDEYMKIYLYLFYMSCLNEEKNPFANVPELDKEEMVLREIGGSFSPDEEEISKALDFTRKLYSTPSSNLYLGAKIAMENAAFYLRTSTLTDGKDGNSANIKGWLKDMGEILQSYKTVYREFQEEQTTHTRGGNQLAYDQV